MAGAGKRHTFWRTLSALPEAMGIVCLLGMVVIVLLNISLRLLRVPIPWAEEVTVGLFVWLAFLGAFSVSITAGHIAIRALVDHLPGAVRKAIDRFVPIISMAAFAVTAVMAYRMFLIYGHTEMVSLNVSAAWIWAAPVVGFALLAIAEVGAIVRFGKGGV